MLKKIIVLAIIACVAIGGIRYVVTRNPYGKSDTAVTAMKKNRGYSREKIEKKLDLKRNRLAEWSYDEKHDAWTLEPVTTVAYPVDPEDEGVSVCIPGAYVTGIDTDKDGTADITAKSYTGSVMGRLIIDKVTEKKSSNGQVYTALTAPVIVNVGSDGFSELANPKAGAKYASEGYINVACGNRGRQSMVLDQDGETTYYGNSPAPLIDQKAAIRYVKYNILLGNLPGSVDRFVVVGTTGGGGAQAALLASTGNNADYFDYLIELGAAGVYADEDGEYSSSIELDGEDTEVSDACWGCVAVSPVTSLKEADMALAFEYTMNPNYRFSSTFQKQLAADLSKSYMAYINGQKLKVKEKDVGADLDGDGEVHGEVELRIRHSAKKHQDTNGYYGSYLNLYHHVFEDQLNRYLDELKTTEGVTWFRADGTAMTDEEVAAMKKSDRVQAFLEGRYAPAPVASMTVDVTDTDALNSQAVIENVEPQSSGTPSAGTTQSTGSTKDSENYETFDEMLKSYQDDIAAIEGGDEYGKNITDLYDPTIHIAEGTTQDPGWVTMVLGAQEGDISLLNSLNLAIRWENAGTKTDLTWAWDRGHEPADRLEGRLPLLIDRMVGQDSKDAIKIQKPKADVVKKNGTAAKATAANVTSWIQWDKKKKTAHFSLASAQVYRTQHAVKAVPGFDVIDYGQEDELFGSASQNARHWDDHVLDALNDDQETLRTLFNKGTVTETDQNKDQAKEKEKSASSK